MHRIALSKYFLNGKERQGITYLYERDEININKLFYDRNVKDINNMY